MLAWDNKLAIRSLAVLEKKLRGRDLSRRCLYPILWFSMDC